jgi:hypothetical protein
MGMARQLLGVVGLLALGSAFALRPFLSNPAAAAALDGGISGWQIPIVLLLVLATLVVAVRRIASSRDGDGSTATADARSPSDDDRWVEMAGAHSGEDGADERDRLAEVLEEQGADPEVLDRQDGGGPPPSAFLSGQGGARDRGFEVEERPPDATLGDHLEHLRAELGKDGESIRELEELEAVVEETEDGSTIPDRCPQEHCNAAWAERGIIGINTGRYELLDDGVTVRCLECEQTTSLE